MALAAGTRLGPYEILASLGAGGMGEVYRARDTRLDRAVAIKVLPSELSSSPGRRERFEREAKTISSLNHPHICTLHDIGHQDGIDYLVMECLEGETLATRLEGGPLTTPEVLRYGVEIADALSKAHRQGITHRDLKPANIMLTKSGAKLLDFGLAKIGTGFAPAPAGQGTSLQGLETLSRSLTAEGTLLGTFPYMAPEQLEGKEADARTDIFALGAVLYEMTTGRKAFDGKSQASIIAAILSADPPPIATLQPMSPPGLDRVVKTCLAKDPDDRFQTAHDLKLQLQWIAEGRSGTGFQEGYLQAVPPRNRLSWMLAAVSMLALGLLGGWVVSRWRERPAGGPTIRFRFGPPEKVSFRPYDTAAVSPDGARIAMTGSSADGQTHLWVRRLDSLSTELLPGTEGSVFPFWSPDSQSIGFFANGKLKRINLAGGSPQTLCDAEASAAAWSVDGVILFRYTKADPLYRVPAAGGEPKPATELDTSRQETGHGFPEFLPDGRQFLFYAASTDPKNRAVYVSSLDSKKRRRLLAGSLWAKYSPPGYLLFVRGSTLMAQQFNWRRLELTADPVSVAEQVAGPGSPFVFSISQNGLLVYRTTSGGNTELVWFDRHGERRGGVGAAAEYSNPSLSMDDKHLAVGRMDPQTNTRDLWVFNLTRGTSSRLTFDPADDLNPVWTHDGSRVFFTSNRKGERDIYEKPANGIGTEEVVLESKQTKYVNALSPDGRYLVYDTGGGTVADLWILPLSGDRGPFLFVQGNPHARSAQVSPNGRFMAYASNESGSYEVYVQTFPEKHGKWQISTEGGTDPMWRHDGKELFYMGPAKLMAVEVKTDGSSFQADIPKPLFEIPLLLSAPVRNHYVVTSDGQRFLFNAAAEGVDSATINVVVNWLAGLKK